MPKRILEGEVVSDKMDKTVTVLVTRRYRHPVYKKYIMRTDKYAAHDENNSVTVGQRVQIQECKPISKRKTWIVIQDDTVSHPPAAMTEAAKKPEANPAAKKEEANKAETKKAAPVKTATKSKAKDSKKDA